MTVNANTSTNQDFAAKANYWAGVQDAFGYTSVWSIWEADNAQTKIFTDKSRKVTYTCYDVNSTTADIMNDTAKEIQFSTFAVGGKVADLYCAAEYLIAQSREICGNHHVYIEDFAMQDDGSLQLVTGS
jgi:hypothetical protein